MSRCNQRVTFYLPFTVSEQVDKSGIHHRMLPVAAFPNTISIFGCNLECILWTKCPTSLQSYCRFHFRLAHAQSLGSRVWWLLLFFLLGIGIVCLFGIETVNKFMKPKQIMPCSISININRWGHRYLFFFP